MRMNDSAHVSPGSLRRVQVRVPNVNEVVSHESGVPVEELVRSHPLEEAGPLQLRLAGGMGVDPNDVEVGNRQITVRGRAMAQVRWFQSQAVLGRILSALGNPLGGALVAESLGPVGLLETLGVSVEGRADGVQLDRDVVIAQGTDRVPRLVTLNIPEDPQPGGFRHLSAADRKTLAFVGVQAEHAEMVRSLVFNDSVDPDETLVQAMKNHRILGFGERHDGNMPERKHLLSLLPGLRASGATHLALEMDAKYQPALDRFERTGVLDLTEMPEFVREWTDYQQVLQEAHQLGLRLLAVDDHSGSQEGDSHDGGTQPSWTVRDDHMALSLQDVLAQDPDHKVVFWVGHEHLSDAVQGSTAWRLRERGVDVFTTRATDPSLPTRLALVVEDSRVPLGIARSTAGQISAILAGSKHDLYGDTDLLVTYPKSAGPRDFLSGQTAREIRREFYFG
ncbi:MAG: ChaN family lipoprotein [Candidatus Eremiobacterota bacterium]